MVNPYKFVEDLTNKLPEDAIVVCANGTACVTMHQVGIVKKGQRIFWNSGCASMGYALPAAIGACIASGKEVVCIEGDGSIMMNLQELQTIKHHNLPIKIFVLNNGGYHSIQETQDNYFNSDYIGCTKEDVSFPNFSKIANAFGIDDYMLMQHEDTTNIVLDRVLQHKGNYLCEVMLGDYKFRKCEI